MAPTRTGSCDTYDREIRDAELAKLPYMVIFGDREAESGEISVRSHADGDLGAMSPGALGDRLT